jgi:hypothetical protein
MRNVHVSCYTVKEHYLSAAVVAALALASACALAATACDAAA